MVILDSESIYIVVYAEAATEQPKSIPLLSLLEKNAVVDQMAWDEAFPKEHNEPNLS